MPLPPTTQKKSTAHHARAASPSIRVLLSAISLLLLIAACSEPVAVQPQGELIPIEALPQGYGRGFAEIVMDGAERGELAKPGQPAPNFVIQLDDGQYIELDTLVGRPVMLNFWATWCGPCRLEMPEIVAAATADSDLVILAVNVQEELAAIEPFATEFEMSMPVVRDVDGGVRNAYGVRGMPTTIFIDREGNISSIWAGLLTGDLLDELLADIR